jgi:hypothetical protein
MTLTSRPTTLTVRRPGLHAAVAAGTAGVAALVLATPAGAAGQSTLTALRTGQHPGYDRVVLQWRGAVPGHTVRWVTRVVADPSGRTVAMRGSAYLQIRTEPAVAHTSSGARSYPGPTHFAVNDPQLRDVAVTGDVEGVVSVALGLRSRTKVHVFTLSNPSRLVVDVAH